MSGALTDHQANLVFGIRQQLEHGNIDSHRLGEVERICEEATGEVFTVDWLRGFVARAVQERAEVEQLSKDRYREQCRAESHEREIARLRTLLEQAEAKIEDLREGARG